MKMSLFPEMMFTEASIQELGIRHSQSVENGKIHAYSSMSSWVIHCSWRIWEDPVVLSFQQKWVPSLYTLPCKSSSSSHWKLQPERARWAQKGGWLVFRAVGFLKYHRDDWAVDRHLRHRVQNQAEAGVCVEKWFEDSGINGMRRFQCVPLRLGAWTGQSSK